LSSVTSAAPVPSSPAGNMWSGCYNAGRAAAGRRARSSVGGRARQPHDQPRCAEMVALAVAPPPWRHILDDLPARSQVWRGCRNATPPGTPGAPGRRPRSSASMIATFAEQWQPIGSAGSHGSADVAITTRRTAVGARTSRSW